MALNILQKGHIVTGRQSTALLNLGWEATYILQLCMCMSRNHHEKLHAWLAQQPYQLLLPLLLLSRFSRVRLCATPLTAAHHAPLSLGLCRQEYWSGLPFPSPAVTADMLYALLSWLTHWTHWTQPWCSSNAVTFQWSLYMCTAQSSSWPSQYPVMRMCGAITLSCYVIIIYKIWGKWTWTHHLG